MSLYLLLMVISFALPFLLSFDKKVHYYTHWRTLIPSIVLVAVLYIGFDVYITSNGYWGFNSAYLIGIKMFELPLEEWLFFVLIPFASLFVHYVFKAYSNNKSLSKQSTSLVSIGILVLMLSLYFYKSEAYYSKYIALKTGLAIALAYTFKLEDLSSFYYSFLFILIPFFVVNGILTGTGIEGEVVWYSEQAISGFRLITIPIEDVFYAYSLLLYVLIINQLVRRYYGSKA